MGTTRRLVHRRLRSAAPLPAFLAILLVVSMPSWGQTSSTEGLNLVPNDGFFGDLGSNLGVSGSVPTLWRGFAVAGSQAGIGVQNVPAGALFAGSPATQAARLEVTNASGDAGLDHEEYRFGLVDGETYRTEVYLRSLSGSESVLVQVPIFGNDGSFTGQTPGAFTAEVTGQWRKFTGPVFSGQSGQTADISFRIVGTGTVLIAQPKVSGPGPGYPAVDARGSAFSRTDRFVATSFFQWYNTGPRSQNDGAWRPLEGRSAWTGTRDFWRDQLKDVMDAGIDVLYVHEIPDFEVERVEMFRAHAELRREGYDVPYIAPFLDTVITWNEGTTFFDEPLDLGTNTGKDLLAAEYIRFFQQYFGASDDPAALSYVLQVEGRTALNSWVMQAPWVLNLAQLTRPNLENRLRSAFATTHPALFQNGIYMIGTTTELPSWSDESIIQFSNNEYFSVFPFNGKRSATMKGGYWDENIRDPGSFLARNGGAPYRTAWDDLVAASGGGGGQPPIYHAYIESWNEYDESTGIYAAKTGPPVIGPANTGGNSDTWSSTNNPREYIDTTADGAARFRGDPARDAEFLWHDIPEQVDPGQPLNLRILVRNQGSNEWNQAGGYRLDQLPTDSFVFGSGRHAIDDGAVETAKYGGAFRGRPVLFEIDATAPATEGRYELNFRMAAGGSRFGDTLTATLTVGDPPQLGPCVASPTAMCLENDRFEVTGTVVAQGQTRMLQMVALTPDTGYGWFLNAQNLEVFVKVLDGCSINRKFWVFVGGLTNLEVNLQVRNTITGQVFTKSNPPRTDFVTESDTSFFDGCPTNKGARSVAELPQLENAFYAAASAEWDRLRTPSRRGAAARAAVTSAGSATCTADATTMCLENDRFAVTGTVVAQGETKPLQMVGLTADTGYGWFLNAQNLEVFVKVLDACAINDRFWVFLGGLTNLEVELQVRNTVTGEVFTKNNPPRTNFQTESNTSFFTGCP